MGDVSEGSLGVSDGDGLSERRSLHDQGSRHDYILFFIDIASRSVHVAGITPHPDNAWMTQMARNVIDIGDGFLRGKRYLILDRDAKYSDAFCGVLAREGTRRGSETSCCCPTPMLTNVTVRLNGASDWAEC